MRSSLTMPILAFGVLLYCAASLAQDTKEQEPKNLLYAELTKVPPKAAARRNPLQSDPQAVAGGAKLFARHCAECHGESADGGKGKKGPSLIAREIQAATPGTLFWLLTNGVVRRGMPVWSKLPEPQRWQLVSYIESLNAGGQTKAADPASP